MHTNPMLNSYLLNGLADLVNAIIQPFGLYVKNVTNGSICSALLIEDYSLSIEEHAAAIRKNISSIYTIKVEKNQIIIIK